ncbi:hypothetical protein ACFC3F_04325 [Microbacterium sp. NPDC055910]|uniref:hypothetical protein n=1 Tax=Microbacterium sp. NPDC055910 TaxID=3345659 RepID=UPI0035DD8297
MNAHTEGTDEDAPLAPEQMLALLENQRRSVEGQVASFVPTIILTWGIAWLAGFGVLWMIDGLKPDLSIPLPVAATIFAILIVGAIVLSAILGIRSGRGMRGNAGDAFQGIVYGCAWMLGGIAIAVFGQGLIVNGMDPEVANIYYPVAYVLFAGLMYVVSGAMWRAVPALILGVWTIIVGLVAPFFGYPTHYLFMALAGGLGLIALAVAAFIHLARLRRTIARAGEVRRG